MAKLSRDKGKRVERLAIKALRQALSLGRQGRRTSQVDGGLTADIVGILEGLHLEVKGRKGIGAARFMEQAVEDAAEGRIPVVLMKEDRGDFLAMVRVRDLPEFAREVVAEVGNLETQ